MAGAKLFDGYDVVVCRDCGFGFADAIPEQEVFDAYYRDVSKYEHVDRGGQQTSLDMVRLAALADIVQTQVPSNSAILDVGCSTGALLNLLKERGFPNITGLDPSPYCAETAKRLYGIRVRTGSLAAPVEGEPGYNCLILAAVLEHVRDLAGLFDYVKRWLRPEGFVVVDVPNAGEFLAGQNAPFQEFSVEHINFFTSTSLNNLMGQHGFGNVYMEQVVRELAYNVSGAELIAVYRYDGKVHSRSRDTITETALRQYITYCQGAENNEASIFRMLVEMRKPIIVWGVGTHAQRLLATNSSRQGQHNRLCRFQSEIPGQDINGPSSTCSARTSRSRRRNSYLIMDLFR
jgi:2-polyprenyl-3-methyl-5-hydroxy-6-metoxy-1,4-benzoquinol methylase